MMCISYVSASINCMIIISTFLLLSGLFAKENIISNASFEQAGKSDAKAAFWQAGKYLRDATVSKLGKYSIKIDGRNLYDASSDKFLLEGGTKYEVRFWHKDMDGISSIYIQQLNVKNMIVVKPFFWQTGFSMNWKQESFMFFSHPDAVYGQITLRVQGNGPCWFDVMEINKLNTESYISGAIYTYSVQPNDGIGDASLSRLTDGDTDIQSGVNWAGGIIKDGLDIDFNLRGRYIVRKIVIYSCRPQKGMMMEDCELYLDDGSGYLLNSMAPGYLNASESLGKKITTFDDIDANAQNVRLRLKSPIHLRLLEIEIYGELTNQGDKK